MTRAGAGVFGIAIVHHMVRGGGGSHTSRRRGCDSSR